MPSISVIVPVYQAEKFLRDCVESVRRQTFSDWELLLVDDGCTDGSPALCDELAREDDRIRVFHKERNSGVSETRNVGLDHVRGTYIAFLDSDDQYEPQCLETLWNLRERAGADTAACAHLNLWPDGSETPEPVLPAGIYDADAIREKIVNPLLGDRLAQPVFNGFIWRYLFSAEIFDRLHLRYEGAYLEDELFLMEYFCNARRLAEMAHEDTGFGKVEDKIIKNIFGSRGVYEYVKDMKTVGELERDEEKKVRTIAVPVGVIAGLVPSTNPTSTALYKAEIAIKAGNAIVFSPHPTALRCISETVKVIRQAISEAGGNENLVSCITIPTMEATDNLMRHRDVAMILATGGSAMVRAAYSSGTPAIGVGPGNGPAYLEKTCDLPLAVKRIMDSKTFDNGTICASEQSIICDEDMVPAVRAEMEKQGAYFLNESEREKLGRYILRANGTMNPEIVGRSVETIARLAGLTDVPATARVLVAAEDGVGRGHPYSNEKLAPILAFYTGTDYKDVCEKVCTILRYEGAGHTFSMHTKNDEMVDYFAKRVPASRIMVNTPSALGGIGGTTGLMPALTLGCGAVGGSATSENVGPMQLLNTRKVAYGLKELEDIRASVPDCSDGICRVRGGDLSTADVEDIVRAIMARLQNA